jgi:hypothetical protein
MPIEHLKRLQKHFDLCILRAPEHDESEWFRRWRNCLGHLIDFPGMSLSAAWDASDPARYKAHTDRSKISECWSLVDNLVRYENSTQRGSA